MASTLKRSKHFQRGFWIELNNLEHIIKRFITQLLQESGATELVISFSGGMDSMTLFELASSIAPQLGVGCRALHIDHGLSEESKHTSLECEKFARAKHVPIEIIQIYDKPNSGDSVESWAREQRYNSISQRIDKSCLVLTAHHLDDQVETILQRILSGSGPHGLSGMLPLRRLYPGFLGRPFLNIEKEELTAFAQSRGLKWVEDPMNRDPRYQRNQIRQQLVPIMKTISPSLVNRLGNLSRIQMEVANILDQVSDERILEADAPSFCLPIQVLENSDVALRPFVLKRAFSKAGLPTPRETKIQEVLNQMLTARLDSSPLIKMGKYEIRRYKGIIYMMQSLHDEEILQGKIFWTDEEEIVFPWGVLSIDKDKRVGIDKKMMEGRKLNVRFRRGGERFHPHQRSKGSELKKLFQEWQLPPWERALMPLIYLDDELAAVGSTSIGKQFSMNTGEGQIIGFDWKTSLYQTFTSYD